MNALAILRKKLLFSLSCLFMLSSLNAQSINGIIMGSDLNGENCEKLTAASIIIRKEGAFLNGITTDSDGNFSLNLSKGRYELEVSYIGYKTYTVNIDNNENPNLIICLAPVEALEEVVVVADGENYTVGDEDKILGGVKGTLNKEFPNQNCGNTPQEIIVTEEIDGRTYRITQKSTIFNIGIFASGSTVTKVYRKKRNKNKWKKFKADAIFLSGVFSYVSGSPSTISDPAGDPFGVVEFPYSKSKEKTKTLRAGGSIFFLSHQDRLVYGSSTVIIKGKSLQIPTTCKD